MRYVRGVLARQDTIKGSGAKENFDMKPMRIIKRGSSTFLHVLDGVLTEYHYSEFPVSCSELIKKTRLSTKTAIEVGIAMKISLQFATDTLYWISVGDESFLVKVVRDVYGSLALGEEGDYWYPITPELKARLSVLLDDKDNRVYLGTVKWEKLTQLGELVSEPISERG